MPDHLIPDDGGQPLGRATEELPAGTREPAQLLEVSLDAPQFQVAAAHPARVARGVAAMFFISLLAFAGFGAAYWQNANNQFLGGTLAVGFVAIGIGMVAWGKYLMPRGPFSEARHGGAPSDEEREAFVGDFASRGKVSIERRGFLLALLGAAGAVFGVVALFPLLRSLGPLPGSALFKTKWQSGSPLTTSDRRRVHKDDLEVGGVLTVFPPDDVGGEMSQTMLVRVASGGSIKTAPGRETWGPDGYLAFSKVCTHAGCPVALYERALHQLMCPCHQSMFAVGPGQAAAVVFGPAPRPLPQLPLYIDSSGYLRAQGGYDEPVGPGFWNRGAGRSRQVKLRVPKSAQYALRSGKKDEQAL